MFYFARERIPIYIYATVFTKGIYIFVFSIQILGSRVTSYLACIIFSYSNTGRRKLVTKQMAIRSLDAFTCALLCQRKGVME